MPLTEKAALARMARTCSLLISVPTYLRFLPPKTPRCRRRPSTTTSTSPPITPSVVLENKTTNDANTVISASVQLTMSSLMPV